MKNSTTYCEYYQVTILKPEKTWFIVSVLKSYDHLAFDRALEGKPGVFEFFVPIDQEQAFLQVMKKLADEELVGTPQKLPNRLLSS